MAIQATYSAVSLSTLRALLVLGLAVLGLAGLPSPACAQDDPGRLPTDPAAESPSLVKLNKAATLRMAGRRDEARKRGGGTEEGEAAVIRALRWLQSVQEPDGSWKSSSGGGGPSSMESYQPGMTGLALLCFLGHGETPASEEYGQTVQKAITWLVANQKDDGTFAASEGKNYSLPIATLALAEAYMMTQQPEVKKAAATSVKLLLKKQHDSGCWYWYSRSKEGGHVFEDKNPEQDDTSLSGWSVQALSAAKTANLKVANLEPALKKAGAGFKELATPRGPFLYLSGGKNQPPGGANGLTAPGVLGLQLSGQSKSMEVQRGLKSLSKATCDWSKPWDPKWSLYYWHFLTQVNFRVGGLTWKAWNKSMSVQIPGAQTVLPAKGNAKEMGYWDSIDQIRSRVYATALCTLMLEVYYR